MRPTSIDQDVANISSMSMVPTMLEVVCRTTGMGFAAIARVTDEHWVACSVRDEVAFGLKPGDELGLETTLCNEIRQHKQPIVIDHVKEDQQYCDHHTPERYGLQSYISFPIFKKDGAFFGTLCAIDAKPAQLNSLAVRGMFVLFADLIAHHLDAVEGQRATELSLTREREEARLREQFIAVLGHDLRNPLGAILSSTDLLMEMIHDAETQEALNILKRGSYRMAGLLDQLTDFARGRLGSGMKLDRESNVSIAALLHQVIGELQAVHTGRRIVVEQRLDSAVNCDKSRVAQLLSNLLANALTHGDPAAPVRVLATSTVEGFTLQVSNAGPRIQPDVIEVLFKPFHRGGDTTEQKGLGLGLYIASEIARAHGGTLTCTSTSEGTDFTFTLPIGKAISHVSEPVKRKDVTAFSS